MYLSLFIDCSDMIDVWLNNRHRPKTELLMKTQDVTKDYSMLCIIATW